MYSPIHFNTSNYWGNVGKSVIGNCLEAKQYIAVEFSVVYYT